MTEIRNICCISYSKLQEKKNSIFLGGILQSGSILISSIFHATLDQTLSSSKMEDRNDDQSTVDVESGERLRPSAVRSGGAVTWPTVDGPLGVSLEEAEGYARRFFLWGFAFLPLLWAVNCFYFWPVLVSKPSSSSPSSFNRIRPCKF